MNRFTKKFEEADESFNKKYQKEIEELKGLSEDEINSISPDTSKNTEARKKLIKVVEEASKKNLSKAKLLDNIKQLEKTAVEIAKKIPSFKDLL